MPTASTANTIFILRLSMGLRVMISQWLNGRSCSCPIGNDVRLLGTMEPKARRQLCVYEIHSARIVGGEAFRRSIARRLGGLETDRLDSGRHRDYCLMVDVRVTLVQLCRQALGLFLLEELRPGPNSSGDAGFPMDSVRFHFTVPAGTPNALNNPCRPGRQELNRILPPPESR